MFDVSSVIIQIQQQIIDMQRNSGFDWFKLITPAISFISPILAFALSFISFSKQEDKKYKKEIKKIKESVESELKHEYKDLDTNIKIAYDNISAWDAFFKEKKGSVPWVLSGSERSLFSFEKYGVDYYCLLKSDDKKKIKNIISSYDNLNLKTSVLKENKNKYLAIKKIGIDVIILIADNYSSKTIAKDDETYQLIVSNLKSAKLYLESLFDYLYTLVSLKSYINELVSNNNLKVISDVKISSESLTKKSKQKWDIAMVSKEKIDTMKNNIDRTFVITEHRLYKIYN